MQTTQNSKNKKMDCNILNGHNTIISVRVFSFPTLTITITTVAISGKRRRRRRRRSKKKKKNVKL